ncbi:RES family NAD+ phosphorylase [Uliginosibacterium sp. H3]|uniref:RES family NAD+ phosphorylase n=1 Tax=Uliginosibacterium silvisoli TaxID=3114758 RepID=A0ABU6K0L9_9RHOO|nr:RES family NAD+ phosphorylase [Uliginosibacterium sp. H3]
MASFDAAALGALGRPLRATLWRMVESQHVASTMKLVDSAAEQDVLEILLEQGKPPLPLGTTGLDYLLASPFRYPPYPAGSRFRSSTDPGVFYGAPNMGTAAAELGYWRWRFLLDSPALQQVGPVLHTAFRAKVNAICIDLREPPFDAQAAAWTAARDYGATQALARSAREAKLQAIVYASVRDPQQGWCAALLTPEGFARRKPEPLTQSWWLTATRQQVVWRRESETMSFATQDWR